MTRIYCAWRLLSVECEACSADHLPSSLISSLVLRIVNGNRVNIRSVSLTHWSTNFSWPSFSTLAIDESRCSYSSVSVAKTAVTSWCTFSYWKFSVASVDKRHIHACTRTFIRVQQIVILVVGNEHDKIRGFLKPPWHSPSPFT